MIYLSFVEEMIQNPKYQDYVGGRIEVTHPDDHFHSEEIRFFTKKIHVFMHFRDRWDMKEVDRETLQTLKAIVAREFYDKIHP